MSVDGERCPEIEYAPRTPEGRAVAEAIDRIGVWKRAGMSGQVVGLDLAEALAGLPRGLDRQLCRRLLVIAEEFYLAAYWQREQAKDK